MNRQTRKPSPKLRADLDIVRGPSDGAGDAPYLLSDPVSGRIFEIGERERLTLTLLDGTLSLEGVRTVLSTHPLFSSGALPTPEGLASFVNQLAREGLFVGSEPGAVMQARTGSEVRLHRVASFPIRAALRWLVIVPWDFLSLGSRSDTVSPSRLRVGNPDPLLAQLARGLGPLVGRFSLALVAVFSILGFGLLIANFGRWWDGARVLWSPWGLLTVAVVGVFLVHIPHQLAHGVACVHYGGRVSGWGVRFLFHVVPTFWVDISDIMWLREKRDRLMTIGVGLLWQLGAFSAGLVGWLVTDRGTGPSVFFLALSTTALFGLFLNANPFARRDLYQLLSAWLDMEDLRLRAREYLRAWVRWRPVPEPLTGRQRRWIGAYGVAVNVFGLVITGAVVALALRVIRDHGESGAVGVLFAAGLVFQDHVRTVFDQAWWKRLTGAMPRTARWVGIGALLVAATWALCLPYPYEAGGDFELVPQQVIEIRSELEGLVGEVFVREGDWVERGAPVAALVTHVQERNLRAAEARMDELLARRSALLAGTRPEEIHRARTALLTAEARLAWSSARADRYESLFNQGVVGLQEHENAIQVRRINESELEEARSYLEILLRGTRAETLEAVEAEIRSQEAILEYFRGDVERAVLVSPIAGFVTTPRIDQLQGRYLNPGQRDLVATIADTRVVQAEIEIPEEDIEGVVVGKKVRLVTWSYPGMEFEGLVTAVAPVAIEDELKRRKVIRVLTEISNPDGLLKPDMTGFAKVEITDRPLWDVLFRPLWRWVRIEVWSWVP
ncbi:MAG TPA: efflux RND transporter periplasmic adaptor subunit [Chondromyces sp.]|nr:efflux RND transporter periplasmic adaptor subunit [Chondromyces sp.]